ncbi:hypothetical protein DVDV_4245 [Desulfovibrio sp. DV]|nr:hypothetical protein DVDV_4245 [Desulfovibrio sp. DV]
MGRRPRHGIFVVKTMLSSAIKQIDAAFVHAALWVDLDIQALFI